MNLQSLQHPNDPKVMDTDLTETFLDKSLLPQFPARILTQAEEHKRIFRAATDQVWHAMKNNQTNASTNQASGKTSFEECPKVLYPIANQLLKMSKYYTALSGEDYVDITIQKTPIGPRTHDHDDPVLNSIWFCDGTSWKENTVSEGDIFYFPAGFKHRSTIKSRNEKRLSIVLTPLGSI